MDRIRGRVEIVTNYEERLIALIAEDSQIQAVLAAVESLHLNDAWICAGIIRNKVWDTFHQINTPLNDIDVIYFDEKRISWEKEKELEEQLKGMVPNQPWSVKNQARMHVLNGFPPYTSSYDGVSHFPETPTAIAARIRDGVIEVMAPYGFDDLFQLQVRPTPYYQKNSEYHSIYLERIQKKEWTNVWKNVTIMVE